MRQTHFPVHRRLITFKKGDVVPLDRKLGAFQHAGGGLLQALFGFGQMASELIVEGKLKIPDEKVRINFNQLLVYLDGLFVFAERRVDQPAQESMWHFVTRVGLKPQLQGL